MYEVDWGTLVSAFQQGRRDERDSDTARRRNQQQRHRNNLRKLVLFGICLLGFGLSMYFLYNAFSSTEDSETQLFPELDHLMKVGEEPEDLDYCAGSRPSGSDLIGTKIYESVKYLTSTASEWLGQRSWQEIFDLVAACGKTQEEQTQYNAEEYKPNFRT